MAIKNNDQKLLDRILDDERKRRAPNLAMEDYFNYFVADNALKDLDMDADELRDGIVDGAHDCGVDGIWSFVDGRYLTADFQVGRVGRTPTLQFIIMQAKTSPGFQETALEKLHFHLPQLLDVHRTDDDLAPSTNAKLLDRTARFLRCLELLASSFPNIVVRVIYASTSADRPHPNVKSKGNRLIRELGKLASGSKCTIEYLGAAELRELSARSATVVADLVFTETPMSTSMGEAYVCLVRLEEYHKFLTTENGALRLELFESNVRDYAGRTTVNTAISETLRASQSEDFWWFNNGVTIVAAEARIAGKRMVLKDPQIVNGLQTSTEVYHYFQDNTRREDRSLVVKVVVPPESGTRDRIITATNSQTQLPPGALRATEKIQKDLEEALALDGYYYERRANYYRNLGFPIEQVVGMARLAREFQAAALGEPHNALLLSERLLLEDSHYFKIFTSEHDIAVYRTVLDIHIRVDALLAPYAAHGKLLGDTTENWRYHLAYMASFPLTRSRKPTIKALAQAEPQELDDDQIQRLYELLDGSYRSALKSNRRSGVDRLARDPDFTERIRQAVLGDPGLW